MKLFFILTLFILSCCSARDITLNTGITEITFGSGGGFTGATTIYTLKADGKLYEGENLLKSLENKSTLAIFKEGKGLLKYSFNEIGNMNSFIEINSGKSTNRIVWPYGTNQIDSRVISLYSKLNQLTK